MVQVAKKYRERLESIKKNIQDSYDYTKDNVDRFHEFREFVFQTSLSADDISILIDLQKPTLEFNILEAAISSLRGEFAKQQPSLQVRAADGVPTSMITKQFVEQIRVTEAHLRAIFCDAQNDKMEYDIYTDLLSGGFSAGRVFTEYVNDKSLEQNINVERCFDPTLTVWDPMARESHKGDGRYCGELYPMTKEEFEEKFGKQATSDMTFSKSLDGFSWSYRNGDQEFVLVCDYYEKTAKKEKLISLTNGYTVLEREYKAFLKEWEEGRFIEQPPLPDGRGRTTTIETIDRYILCESRVLEHSKTNYRYLPLVYFAGNNINITDGSSTTDMSRPYVYHAKGIQQLKNFAGQSLAAELENMVQHKFVVAEESISEQNQSAYTNVQKADVLMYKHFKDEQNPEVTLPPPREIVRTPIPPQITDTFRMSDEMSQIILGNIGTNNLRGAELSGIAVARTAMMGNNASVPYLVGFIKGLNRIAEIIVDLIPKYYRTPRSLPILLPNGKRSYYEINKRGSLFMNYDPSTFQVKVDTGVNFAIQKEVALQTISTWMQASPSFSQFINTKGLATILDNIDIRGIEDLKLKAEEWAEEQEQAQKAGMQVQQAQAQQAQQEQQAQIKTNELVNAEIEKNLKAPAKETLEAIKIEEKSKKDAAELNIKQREQDLKFLELLEKVRDSAINNELKAAEIDAEDTRSLIEELTEQAKGATRG